MTSEPLPDRRVVVCNYTAPISAASAGAKAYVTGPYGGNLPERVQVLVRSRSGRLIAKWENVRRLGNFRLATLPPEHPRYGDDRIWDGTGEQVANLAEAKAYVHRGTQASG